ncbi:MAG: glycosyltransferase family 9 protein [Geobacteraceae bacterium]|nr:glycosyltransferase family 9 protein [Geobacteraceae bacterium]NTW80067.1 glycosyltransferase family 9 protein [Geobacteraceae bacterium]
MGDLLHLTPTIRALHRRFPHAHIDVMVGNAASVDLFRHHPDITDILVYDRRGEHRSFNALLSLWRQIKSRSYDLVINFQRSNLKTWFLTSAALPCRILVYHKTRTQIIHAVRDHLKTVGPLGIFPDGDELDLYLAEEHRRYAAELFESHGFDKRPVIALNPGASNLIKCWSTHQFASLGDRLADELGAGVIVVGGRGERELAHDICARMHHKPLNMVNKTTMLQLGAVLSNCALLVSGDTGPMHMATAVGTPVVALFGAIDPQRTGPVGEGHRVIRHPEIYCVPCNAKKCHNPHYLECMERISVEEVFAAVEQMLAERNPDCSSSTCRLER